MQVPLSIKQLAVVTNLLKPVSCKALPVLLIFLRLQALQLKPRMLPCQAIMKKQSGSSKPCKSAAVLQVQDRGSCYMIAVIVIGA